MRSVAEQLAIYQQFHNNYINKGTHFIGVPLIIYSLLVLFGWVHIRVPNFFDMPLSWLLSIAVLAYYFFLDITLAAALTVVFIILNVLATLTSGNAPSWLSLQLFLYPFIIGWILQIVGHIFEKKWPAFMTNVWQLLIAPLFLMAEVFFYFGHKENLKQRIDDLASPSM